MSKKYDMTKKSDMHKFQRDLKKKAEKVVDSATEKLEIECPNCGRKFKVKEGSNTCPRCDFVVEYDR